MRLESDFSCFVALCHKIIQTRSYSEFRISASPTSVIRTGKKERKSDCGDWQWSVCVANEGDCGLGTREGTRTGTDCKQTIKTQRCKIPCNWKKKFGGEIFLLHSLEMWAVLLASVEKTCKALQWINL